jgi:hypothetical protein
METTVVVHLPTYLLPNHRLVHVWHGVVPATTIDVVVKFGIVRGQHDGQLLLRGYWLL